MPHGFAQIFRAAAQLVGSQHEFFFFWSSLEQYTAVKSFTKQQCDLRAETAFIFG
jgi:hypothetical protein